MDIECVLLFQYAIYSFSSFNCHKDINFSILFIFSYGLALKHIRLVLECRAHLTNGTCENILMSFLLGRAGDCCFQIARKWYLIEKFRAEFSSSETFDEKMTAVIKEEDVTNYKGTFFPYSIG